MNIQGKQNPLPMLERLCDRNLLRKAVVIGAGSMGSGIAAVIANAGVPVVLLDRASEGADRSALARQGIERQLKGGGFMHEKLAELVTCGNIEDDLDAVVDADWVVEAVFEDLEIKRSLYLSLQPLLKAHTIVSSNTSTIPVSHLTEGMDEAFARNFVITHFFNPPRVMQLLELVSTDRNPAEIVDRAARIGREVLGKSVVFCRDTPGFIANRVGNFWMSVAALEAKRLNLTVEEADAIMSKPFGIPSTGIFGLFDFVGINLVPLVWASFMKILDASDRHRAFDITQDAFISSMLERGLTGRFGPGGFYRRKGEKGERIDEVIDFESGNYRPRTPTGGSLSSDTLRQLLDRNDNYGHYAWTVLSELIVYSAQIASEIAGDIASIDETMRLGYNWKFGPFQLCDQIGMDYVIARLKADGRPVPTLLTAAAEDGFYPSPDRQRSTDGREVAFPSVQGRVTVSALKAHSEILLHNPSVTLFVTPERIALLEFHTKMNAQDSAIADTYERLPALLSDQARALVIANDDPRAFSAGANLKVFLDHIDKGDFESLEAFVAKGQKALLALKYSRLPVVAAVKGLALGAGCEVALHSDLVIAASNATLALPERLVGLIPGWGGVTQLVLRNQARYVDADTAAFETYSTVMSGKSFTSPDLGLDRGLLLPRDKLVMNKDLLLGQALAAAQALASNYSAPQQRAISPAASAFVQRVEADIAAKKYSPTDALIARSLAELIAGHAERSELKFLADERATFMKLSRRAENVARIRHMLEHNKPFLN